jgi:O-antigen ligase
MFSTPGIAALIILIYIKPQEFVPGMDGLPLLYIMLGVATLGVLLDLRLGHARLDLPPQALYVVAFLGWCLMTRVAKAGATGLPAVITDLAIVAVIFFIISTGVSSFRAFEVVAGSLVFATLFVAAVCLHQGFSQLGCALQEGAEKESVRPDGRPCQVAEDCYSGDAEPGATYQCEKTGLFGTVSVGSGRVRYRGVLKDPNEVALTTGVSLSLLIGRIQRKQSITRIVTFVLATIGIAIVIINTQSRGGILVFLAVFAAYFVKALGPKGLIAGGILGLPLVLLGGRSGDEASSSADERSEILLDGLHMFTSNPGMGVGFGKFTDHSHLTAHNSYMLALSENGFFGLFLFLAILALSIKICVVCISRHALNPEAAVARTWSMAILASVVGASVGSFFLSFTYHHVLWIYFAMTGALYTVIRRHDPKFQVKLSLLEHGLVGTACVLFVVGIRGALKAKGL